ncbi:MAG: pyridoxine 5'-phosphate synthase [Bacteroidota bacterium]
MTKLSVNINKVALIRNSRKGNFPNLYKIASDCEQFGAQGITVHPRPDERHVRYADIPVLRELNTTEFNIEGYPSEKFLKLVLSNRPTQCTLVPDAPDVLTSDQGWDTITHRGMLQDIVGRLHELGIRVSLFVDPIDEMVKGAKETGADRIEFYTGDYAKAFQDDREEAVEAHARCAKIANEIGLGINAGHDLSLENLEFYAQRVEKLLEVSIGHALIADALYYGLKNTIQMYLAKLAR